MSLSERFIDDAMTFYAVTTKFDTGVATDSDAVPAYRVYEEETTTPILTGNMALLDSANTAGLYSEQITLSAANGFEVGKCYAIHIAATVNSVAGATHREFVVRKKPLTPTTEGRELDVTAGGEAGIDLDNAAGTLDAAQFGADFITAAKIADGAIDAATFAAGAITAAAIATGAIDADAVAADAVTEIQSGLATAAALATVATYIDTEIGTLQTSVDDLPTNAELATALGTADDAVLAAINDLPTNAELAVALGTADDAILAQIALVKAKTDSLTFTVASHLDVNVLYQNGTQMYGSGATGDLWRGTP